VQTDGLRPRDEFERARLDRLLEVREELGELILGQLAKLPRSVFQPMGSSGKMLLTHGSPVDPLEPFTYDMSDDAMASLIGDAPVELILCGGSHVPFDRRVPRSANGAELSSEVRVINLGSVGEAPMLTERFAHATFIDVTACDVQVEQFSVPLGRAA
jgi:hypothetical protein